MARSIPHWLGGVLERLELERPELVTTEQLERLCGEEGLGVPARVVASRLKKRGWLLETPQRGVWEFASAEAAGAISRSDPLLALKAFRLAHPGVECALTFQSAAWALGLADRVPARPEVAFAERPRVRIPEEVRPVTFASSLPMREGKGAPVLAPEAIIVNMAHRPGDVRSWASAIEWLPEVAYEADADATVTEASGRPAATLARAGYLLQGLRPDISASIAAGFSPKGKARFGQGKAALRNDERWMVSDCLLPFDPRDLEAVR